MTDLNELFRRLVPAHARVPDDEAAQPEMPVAQAQEIVTGPSVADAVASNAPLPVLPNNSDRLGTITSKALDKMAEVLGMTREEMLAMSDTVFERSIAWAKLQLNASEVALRTQVRVDENRLKKAAIDAWPQLEARLAKAREEARRLQEPDAA